MPTATKKPASRRRAPAKKPAATPLPYGIARRPLPPAKGTVADVLKVKNFGKGADWDVIENAHAARDL